MYYRNVYYHNYGCNARVSKLLQIAPYMVMRWHVFVKNISLIIMDCFDWVSQHVMLCQTCMKNGAKKCQTLAQQFHAYQSEITFFFFGFLLIVSGLFWEMTRPTDQQKTKWLPFSPDPVGQMDWPLWHTFTKVYRVGHASTMFVRWL